MFLSFMDKINVRQNIVINLSLNTLLKKTIKAQPVNVTSLRRRRRPQVSESQQWLDCDFFSIICHIVNFMWLLFGDRCNRYLGHLKLITNRAISTSQWLGYDYFATKLEDNNDNTICILVTVHSHFGHGLVTMLLGKRIALWSQVSFSVN